MKQNSILAVALAFLSLVTGYLLSGISLLGRVGISLVYTQYSFLKSWWKGALLVFIVWVLLFIVQSLLHRRSSRATSNIVHAVLLVIAFAGLYSSYADFRHTLSHRWLGERFHLGVYLFWLVWIGITIYILSRKRPLLTNNAIVYPVEKIE